MKKHEKIYKNEDELIQKYQTFFDNHFLVEKLNQIYALVFECFLLKCCSKIRKLQNKTL